MGLRNEDSGIVSECFAGILEYGLLWADGRCPERVLSLIFLVSFLALAACLFDKVSKSSNCLFGSHDDCFIFSMKVISWAEYSLTDARGVEFVH